MAADRMSSDARVGKGGVIRGRGRRPCFITHGGATRVVGAAPRLSGAGVGISHRLRDSGCRNPLTSSHPFPNGGTEGQKPNTSLSPRGWTHVVIPICTLLPGPCGWANTGYPPPPLGSLSTHPHATTFRGNNTPGSGGGVSSSSRFESRGILTFLPARPSRPRSERVLFSRPESVRTTQPITRWTRIPEDHELASRSAESSREIRAALNSEVLRADDGEARLGMEQHRNAKAERPRRESNPVRLGARRSSLTTKPPRPHLGPAIPIPVFPYLTDISSGERFSGQLGPSLMTSLSTTTYLSDLGENVNSIPCSLPSPDTRRSIIAFAYVRMPPIEISSSNPIVPGHELEVSRRGEGRVLCVSVWTHKCFHLFYKPLSRHAQLPAGSNKFHRSRLIVVKVSPVSRVPSLWCWQGERSRAPSAHDLSSASRPCPLTPARPQARGGQLLPPPKTLFLGSSPLRDAADSSSKSGGFIAEGGRAAAFREASWSALDKPLDLPPPPLPRERKPSHDQPPAPISATTTFSPRQGTIRVSANLERSSQESGQPSRGRLALSAERKLVASSTSLSKFESPHCFAHFIASSFRRGELRENWAALTNEISKADEAPECKGGGTGRSPVKPADQQRRTIPTGENPGMTRTGIEPGSPLMGGEQAKRSATAARPPSVQEREDAIAKTWSYGQLHHRGSKSRSEIGSKIDTENCSTIRVQSLTEDRVVRRRMLSKPGNQMGRGRGVKGYFVIHDVLAWLAGLARHELRPLTYKDISCTSHSSLLPLMFVLSARYMAASLFNCQEDELSILFLPTPPLESAYQKQSGDTHETPYDRVKRCRERKINIKASERVDGLECLSPAKANRVQSPAGSIPSRFTPDFRKWESCRTMVLIGGFYRGSPFSPLFQYSPHITLIISQELAVKSRPNLFTHTHSPQFCRACALFFDISRVVSEKGNVGTGERLAIVVNPTSPTPHQLTTSFRSVKPRPPPRPPSTVAAGLILAHPNSRQDFLKSGQVVGTTASWATPWRSTSADKKNRPVLSNILKTPAAGLQRKHQDAPEEDRVVNHASASEKVNVPLASIPIFALLIIATKLKTVQPCDKNTFPRGR
ncbi:hypothetical protein PR048_016733 [Dryococelus australis]|uniref:Uncharacterized protein n=1 Tax=Dryococelus australis TaxID=614101 RepID=A0ABQ9H7M1_9NEOP|nr:hypothetical protein PR048_016733 [Dryococelus australis]